LWTRVFGKKRTLFKFFIISARAEKDKLDALIIPNPGGGIELSFAFQGIASVFSKDYKLHVEERIFKTNVERKKSQWKRQMSFTL
jgi:hypothetical protein